MRGVSHDSFDRNVVGENFVVRVKDRAALRINDLFVSVFFSSKTGVLVVLNYLKINKTKREDAEERDKSGADQRTSASTVRVHLRRDRFATG